MKLHRQVLDNDVFRNDQTAWHVFEVLLLIVDRKNASWSGGRFNLAGLCNINPSTLYKALLRLKKAKMVTLVSNNKYTTIHICNWLQFQDLGNSFSNNKVTTGEQQSNTITRRKKKELRNNNVEVPKNIRLIYDFYIEKFGNNPNQFRLTDQRKAKIKLRLKQNGTDQLKQAIEYVANSPFHRGDNDRGWRADLDFIIRTQEQVERLAVQGQLEENKIRDVKEFI